MVLSQLKSIQQFIYIYTYHPKKDDDGNGDDDYDCDDACEISVQRDKYPS